ncbi:MAG: sodium:solute symporter family protein [Planctomycetes bacterium]|nr:sodium:solute symporter family protein [Planctomycetota bacterium]
MLLAQSLGPVEIIVVVAYFLMVGYLGWLGYTRTKTATDYLVAGRGVHPFVMALSYGATFISTSAIVGFGGVAGMFGMSLLWLTFCNIFVGIFIAFVFLGGPTRRMGHRLEAHTFPELLGRRFESKFIQVFAGLLIFIFIPLYAAAVLIGGCEFIEAKFGIGYDVSVWVFSIIIAAYVVTGGLKGVMYTDALQGSLMFIGMAALLVGTYVALGGVREAHDSLAALGQSQPSLFEGIGFKGWTHMPQFGWGGADPKTADVNKLWWMVVSTMTLGVGIGVLAQPQLAVRFMTVKSKRELNRAVLIGGIFILVMTGVAFTVGALSNVYFREYEKIDGTLIGRTPDARVVAKDEPGLKAPLPAQLMHIDTNSDGRADIDIVEFGLGPVADLLPKAEILSEDPDTGAISVKPRANAFMRAVIRTRAGEWAFNGDSIIPNFITRAMPGWFGLLFLLTMLAAAMSTLSSQFHTLGTSIGRDVYEQAVGTRGSGILVTRIGIIIGILAAIVLSLYMRGGYFIARATAIFMGLCASAFLPTFIGGLFSRRVTRPAAISSMVTGFFVTGFWLLFVKDQEARAMGLCWKLLGKRSLFVTGDADTILGKGLPTIGNWNVVDPIVVALPLSALVLILVTLFTKAPDKAHLTRCFGEKR